MDRLWAAVEAFLASPILWGVVALIALSLALSGKLSMNAATLILWIAWGAAAFGIYRAEIIIKLDPLLRYLILGTLAGALAVGAVLLGRWIKLGRTEAPVSATLPAPSANVKSKTNDFSDAERLPLPKPILGGKTHTAAPILKPPPKSSAPTAIGPRLGIGPEAYKEISDEQVGQWAIEEADKIEELANRAMNYWGGVGAGVSVNAISWRFTNEFNDCCAQDVKEVRTEVLRRLGPPAKDPEEIQAMDCAIS